jgi:hypothetical protein
LADFLRALRDALYQMSSIQVYGIGIDIFLHLLLAFAGVLLLHKLTSRRNSVLWVLALIVLKEMFDIFAKSRLEYIRAPALDFTLDILFGLLGIGLALVWLKRKPSSLQQPAVDVLVTETANTEATLSSAASPALAIPEAKPAAQTGSIGARLASIVLAFACLFLLAQGIYYSDAQVLFGVIAALGMLLFVASRYRSEHLVFVLVGLGPLINRSSQLNDAYLYPIEVVLLACFFLWFLFAAKRTQFSGLSVKLYLLFSLALVPGVVEQVLAGAWLAELRLLRGYFIGLCLVLLLGSLAPAQAASVARSFLIALFFAGYGVLISGGIEYAGAVLNNGSLAHETHSLFSSSETLAIYLAVLIPIALFTPGLFRSGAWNFLTVFLGLAGFALLLTTGSRIGLLAVILTVALYLLFTLSTMQHRRSWVLLLLIGIGVAGVATIAAKTLRTSTGDVGNIVQFGQALLNARATAWTGGLALIAESALTGNGAVVNVYNTYLQIGASFGVVALALFLLLLLYCLTSINHSGGMAQARLSLVFGCYWGLISLLLVSLAQSTLGNQLAYVNWAIIFLVACRSLWLAGPQAADKGVTAQSARE